MSESAGPRPSNQAKTSQEWGYSRFWRLFTVIILVPVLRSLMRHRWEGRENLPRTGGYILAPNHLSYADWGAIALFTNRYGRRYPVFMIKSQVFGVRFIGPLMAKVGQLPVNRGRGDAGLVLKRAEQALRAGACVIIYPEGTASRDPGLWPMVGKTGAARLALTTGVPVIPVAQWGAHELLPYGTKRPLLFPRKTARVVAGPPVDLSRYAGQRPAASVLRAATADIMADVTALLAKIRQETPPAVPYDPAAAGAVSSGGGTGSGSTDPDAASASSADAPSADG
jgi:1-acyl-sn-glycerol-3-phosphate acyltransferase